jgi:hypothetical protein
MNITTTISQAPFQQLGGVGERNVNVQVDHHSPCIIKKIVLVSLSSPNWQPTLMLNPKPYKVASSPNDLVSA